MAPSSVCQRQTTDSRGSPTPYVGSDQHEWAAQQAPDPVMASTSLAATSATKFSGEEKVPKQLPRGVWAQLIGNYGTQQIQGQDRSFPIQEVLGADQILARIYHELHVSKLFTPVALGEILQKRTF